MPPSRDCAGRQAVCHRHPHRASAAAHRSSAVRSRLRASGVTRRVLSADGAGEGARRLQLLHVPWGWVVPASTEPGGLCTNGMSLKRRDSPLANAALVVNVDPTDVESLLGRHDPWPASPFSGRWKRRRLSLGRGLSHRRSAWPILLAGRRSDSELRSTYRPGIVPGDLAPLLPRRSPPPCARAAPVRSHRPWLHQPAGPASSESRPAPRPRCASSATPA